MGEASIRELRNHGGRVLARVAGGERVVGTSDGEPVAELSVGPLATDDPQERAARQLRLQETEAAFEPLPLDAAAARMFGQVAASLRREGRKPAARAFDALIASIALANQLEVYSCNPDDFAGIDGLGVAAVPHPDR